MEEKMLRELLAITRENNEILHGLNTQRRWANFFWIFKWFIILALAYSAYLASRPYIDQAQATYTQAQEALGSINNLSNQAKQIQNVDQKTFTDFITKTIKSKIGQ